MAAPEGVQFDGKSLIPLLSGDPDVGWPDRTLFFQWHRGDPPEPDRAFAARSQRYKLLRPRAARRRAAEGPQAGALRPGERPGRAARYRRRAARSVAERMHADYLAWFRDVSSTRGFDPVRIDIGGPAGESDDPDPPGLARARGPGRRPMTWATGRWTSSGPDDSTVHLRLTPRRFPTVVHLSLGGVERSLRAWSQAQSECTFHDVPLTAGPGAWRPGSRATATRPACWT